jgi:hypothetical protein
VESRQTKFVWTTNIRVLFDWSLKVKETIGWEINYVIMKTTTK